MKRRILLLILPVLLVLFSACDSIILRFMARSVEEAGRSVERVPNRITQPIQADVPLSILWVGHATTLIQIHDKVFATDPLFTRTVGMVMKRLIEPGIDPASIHPLDYILISHTHFDHFSYASLDLLPPEASLLLPLGALRYTPDFNFKSIREMKPWESFEKDGVTITAVPVQHFSGRYGLDILWMKNTGYTGYVLEYKGITVFFGGDTGYDPKLFREIGRRFSVDVAILPIAPIEPRDFMERNHVDPAQALQIAEDVGARFVIPMHYRTLNQGFDPSPTFAIEQLLDLAREKGISEKIIPLGIGQQKIFSELSLASRSVEFLPQRPAP